MSRDGIQGKGNKDFRSPPFGRFDSKGAIEGSHPSTELPHIGGVDREVTRSIIANVDQQVASIAIPLHTHSTHAGLFNKCQNRTPHDRAARVGDFSGKGSSVDRRLDELDVEIAKAGERAKIVLQALKSFGNWLF